MGKKRFAFVVTLLCALFFSIGYATHHYQPTSPASEALTASEAVAAPETVATPEALTAVAPCPPLESIIPKTNAEIRTWYNRQVVIIPTLNTQWDNEGVNAEERAQRAYDIRHRARLYARALMQDKEEVELLRQRDSEKYGNPDGPTWAYLIEKAKKKELIGDAVYEEIIESSSRTSAEFNQKFGIK